MNVADKVWQVVRERRRTVNTALEKKRLEIKNCMISGQIGQGIRALDGLKELETQLKLLDEIIEEADKK